MIERHAAVHRRRRASASPTCSGPGWTACCGRATGCRRSGSHYQFLDLTGGRKPYLLERVDNHMGAVTTISYAPSTTLLPGRRGPPGDAWRTPLPFPVHVVDRVEVEDEISGGRLTSEFRYHHGYWDGVEREFRGFGMVEQLDTEVVGGPGAGDTRHSPPVLTRTWFHLGPDRRRARAA